MDPCSIPFVLISHPPSAFPTCKNCSLVQNCLNPLVRLRRFRRFRRSGGLLQATPAPSPHVRPHSTPADPRRPHPDSLGRGSKLSPLPSSLKPGPPACPTLA